MLVLGGLLTGCQNRLAPKKRAAITGYTLNRSGELISKEYNDFASMTTQQVSAQFGVVGALLGRHRRRFHCEKSPYVRDDRPQAGRVMPQILNEEFRTVVQSSNKLPNALGKTPNAEFQFSRLSYGLYESSNRGSFVVEVNGRVELFLAAPGERRKRIWSTTSAGLSTIHETLGAYDLHPEIHQKALREAIRSFSQTAVDRM